MWTLIIGILLGFLAGLLVGYYSPKWFAKAAKEVGEETDKLRKKF